MKNKMTNYDRIKSMSVEEMAEWIVGTKLKFGIESHKHDANVIYLHRLYDLL